MPRRRRNIPLYVMVSPVELEQLHARMDEAGVRNMSAHFALLFLYKKAREFLYPVTEIPSFAKNCGDGVISPPDFS